MVSNATSPEAASNGTPAQADLDLPEAKPVKPSASKPASRKTNIDPPSPKRKASRRAYWLWIALLVLIADQVTKAWVLADLAPGGPTMVIASFLNFVYVENQGAAFGVFAGQRWPLSLLGIVVCIGILVWMRVDKKLRWYERVGLSLIVGGALGNVIDRVRFGYVVDFIDFHVGGWHWYAFNVADAAICVGAALMIFASFRPLPQSA